MIAGACLAALLHPRGVGLGSHTERGRMSRLLILDLFCGTKSSTLAFADAGHRVVSFDIDASFEPDHALNIMDVSSEWLLETYGRPDFVWLSPPCTAFSVASIGHHWANGGTHPTPKTEAAVEAQRIVAKSRALAEEMQPRFGFLIENPRGMLRKLPVLDGLERRTVTYCQYGDRRMKPTDLWGTVPGWVARPACRNGDSCHEAAPRGARSGTQGIAGAKDRGRVPYELGVELLVTIERQLTQYGGGYG